MSQSARRVACARVLVLSFLANLRHFVSRINRGNVELSPTVTASKIRTQFRNVPMHAHPNLEEEIRRRAFELYEERGRQDGHDIECILVTSYSNAVPQTEADLIILAHECRCAAKRIDGGRATWAFPSLVICLDCGFPESNLTQTELRMVDEGIAA